MKDSLLSEESLERGEETHQLLSISEAYLLVATVIVVVLLWLLLSCLLIGRVLRFGIACSEKPQEGIAVSRHVGNSE